MRSVPVSRAGQWARGSESASSPASAAMCEFCRSGDLVNCKNQEYTGVHHDGGYAEMMIAKASGLVSVPNDLSSADAAPLLCAGLTTFSALRKLSS